MSYGTEYTCIVPTGLFIDNKFSPAANNETISLENPASATFLATVSAAQESDVERAVESSAAAFKSTWRETAPQVRRALLNKLADLIDRDAEDLASLEAVDAGILYAGSLAMHVPQAVETCRYFAGWVDKLDGDSMRIEQGIAYTQREPIGVCAAIVPWNAPL